MSNKVSDATAVIFRFTARRTFRSATFVALAFGIFAASKIIGYVDIYPTAKERLGPSMLLDTTAYKALFGLPHNIATMTGFSSWYGMGIGILLGSIWAYLVATKAFRGEEQTGRWEMLLASPTSFRRATLATLGGLATSLAVFFLITAIGLIAIGADHAVNYSVGAALYFAAAVTTGAAMFASLGALASQIMPTRARAAGLVTTVLGLAFALRASGDVTTAHWLANISPLGWSEKLQPLVGPQPIWFIPIVALILIASGLTWYIAGRRDLGASLFSDHDTSRAHTALLGSTLAAAIRLTRGSMIAWLAGILAFSLFFGSFTKTAAQAFSTSRAATTFMAHIAGVTSAGMTKSFLGIAFLLLIMILMAYVVYAVGAVRQDEALGYLDNLLVQPVGRMQILLQRIGVAIIVTAIAALASAGLIWLDMSGNTAGINGSQMVYAALNTFAPVAFILGLTLFAYGFAPRLTTVIGYAVIAWSFMLQLAASGLNLNHWLLDTSLFTHVAFAPAASPRWGTNWTLIAISIVLASLGAWMFSRRDLAGE